MGEVYRARDTRLSRDVAVKVLHTHVAADSEGVRRFEQEARATGVLNHQNIVAVYDTGVSAGRPYIVSELLQGESLRERLVAGGLSTRRALDYAILSKCAYRIGPSIRESRDSFRLCNQQCI